MDLASRLTAALERLQAPHVRLPLAPPQARWEVQVAGGGCRVELVAGWPAQVKRELSASGPSFTTAGRRTEWGNGGVGFTESDPSEGAAS